MKIVIGDDKLLLNSSVIALTCTWILPTVESCAQLGTREKNQMPIQTQEQATLNVKLVHFTKQNSPEDPVQVAFAVTDDQGKEEIITGEVPYTPDLFRVFQENGWLNVRRGVASIRETRQQRRVVSA
jgi:hypothetical protein